ncbi:MAG: hypothetical protein ACXVAJ_06725 [Parachlamydiaceae bacterium]
MTVQKILSKSNIANLIGKLHGIGVAEGAVCEKFNCNHVSEFIMGIVKKVVLMSVVLGALSSNSFAAKKSTLTTVMESISSSSYSSVECSMEDYTCQKKVTEMGRQEALSRMISGDNGAVSVVLQQAIAIRRHQDVSAQDLSDDEIIDILASEQ